MTDRRKPRTVPLAVLLALLAPQFLPAARALNLPDEDVIEGFIPKIELATGENCAGPQEDGARHALYSVQAHPDNPDGAALVSVAVMLLKDCGLAGHDGAPGVDAHKYDGESFYMTLVPSSKCSSGWRAHAIKTRAHDGTFARREINEREISGDGCGRPGSLVMSLGKHALYTSWLDCTKRTPAELCATVGDKIDKLNLYKVASVANAREVLTGISDFADVDADEWITNAWDTKLFHPENWSDLEGLPNPGNVDNDHDCPYGSDWDASLCYKKCKSGYKGVATVCWQSCPDGFRDDGAFCAKPEAYGRGAGYTSKKTCHKHDHDRGCEKNGLLWYPKCKSGYKAVGCCVCSPRCEDGMNDIGVSCAKKSYDRGVGVLP